ncbi:hypothetical protein PVAP13_5KG753700 [Panicum virgatum]|uniref:Uncharacterized protein n=1 Tax=Panicum virgatum TaxID=38727 RepID=A0A8T0SWF8_PANVG|nr:hypothetical protein PVAP13_5KG753700 [Panicum virgatum]
MGLAQPTRPSPSPRGALPSLLRLFGTSKAGQRGEREEIPSKPLTPSAAAAVHCARGDRRAAEQATAGGGEQDARSSPAPLHPWVVARPPAAPPPLRPLAKADRLLARSRFSPTFKMAAAPRAITSESLRLVAHVSLCCAPCASIRPWVD